MLRLIKNRHPSRQRQNGVVIITFLLILITASSYALLRALNIAAQSEPTENLLASKEALNRAKAALIGYAVAFESGPGRLPCPDSTGSGTLGSTDANCDLASKTETGRFPWRTLGMDELLDGDGAPLWYALTDAYRHFPLVEPVNSETTGGFTLDGESDIVAVIIAPGPALGNQDRKTSNAYSASDFLEGDNASKGDGSFTAVSGDDANDLVLTLTRAELMAQVETTVMTEVSYALENYFADPDADDVNGVDPNCGAVPGCDDGFPWLSPFAEPGSAGDFETHEDNLVNFGHLPVVAPGEDFFADFQSSWSFASGTPTIVSGYQGNSPNAQCALNPICTEDFSGSWFLWNYTGTHDFLDATVTGDDAGDWLAGSCQLSGQTQITCTAELAYTLSAATTIFGNPAGTMQLDLIRRWVVEYNGPDAVVLQPSAITARDLFVQINGANLNGSITITVSDSPNGFSPFMTSSAGSATLEKTTMQGGDSFTLIEVPFDLEIDSDNNVDWATSPGSLPNWFHTNDWHELIYVHYAQDEEPGALNADCTVGGTCLRLNTIRPNSAVAVTDANARGLVISTGALINEPNVLVQNRPGNEANYLEGDNVDGTDLSYELNYGNSAFNDQIILLGR
ncbi:MAG: hypothetical protein AAF384_04360 [Pseudomonadota bacterium]